jgi:flagellar basal-body rod protein FlgG
LRAIFLKLKCGHTDCYLSPWGNLILASGLWPIVSGAVAQQHAVDTVANNLANMDTHAFKKDAPTFREYLASEERVKVPMDVPRSPIQDKDMTPLDGKDQSFVVVDGTYSNFKQGNLRVTQSPLDLAIEGPGFFEVNTPNGIRLTRAGSMKLSSDGTIVTKEGFPVLMSQPGGLATALPTTAVQPNQGRSTTQGGVAAEPVTPPEVLARMINVRDVRGAISVTDQGEIYGGDQLIGRISMVELADPRKLRKQGNQLFSNPDPANLLPDAANSKVRQGMLETSNVNPVEEMTKLIQANRAFEQGLKSMKVYDDIMSKESAQIGRLQ